MSSICNDERACFGDLSGSGGFVHSLSVVQKPAIQSIIAKSLMEQAMA
jgi:hypothetical protein